ncbi:MAG: hypothetical protein Aurels2KO_04070 [Aureliella sp.]
MSDRQEEKDTFIMRAGAPMGSGGYNSNRFSFSGWINVSIPLPEPLTLNHWPHGGIMLQQTIRRIVMFFCLVFGPISILVAADTVEFLTGATLEGKVTRIRKPQGEFDFETKIGRRTVRKTYKFALVHAVTLNGQRHVLTPKPATGGKNGDAGEPVVRSMQEVRQLIDTEGASDPEWMERTKSALPNALDVSWPLQPPKKGWNNQQNVGQYIWDIVNPNPNRWRQGIKMVKEITDSHADQKPLLVRDQKALGRMYFHLLQDYPRAAYWFEQAKVNGQMLEGIMLAECYYRLGNRDMAMRMLTQRSLPPGAIKLLAELGEINTARRLAESFRRTQAEPNAMLLIADAMRNLGRNEEALQYYEAVLNSNQARNKDYKERFCGRAQDSIDAIGLADKADVSKVADGRYKDSSVGYNGPVEVEVTVKGNAIKACRVVKHKEKQFYSSLRDTPKQIMEKQSVQGIDGFSGATITSAAIVNAAAKALAQGAQ